MMSSKQLISIIKQQMPKLREDFGVKRIAVFGSIGTARFNKKSDVDLLIEFSAKPGIRFIALIDYLGKVLHRKVDVLTQEGLKSIPHKQIAASIRKSLQYV